eukprot:TRINITY_DN6372_c0_g1_i1.p1 TRINITY_DN6372_c0_g1~~TRINITY_DN6372_c0_g1_i1.p1  ORF type:complete len:361 (+),score=12.27 TRINITY_DN6372_c0_g1_i1:62-1144(+)
MEEFTHSGITSGGNMEGNVQKKRRKDRDAVSDQNGPGKASRSNRVQIACVSCHKSHMSCFPERPCRRCVDRGIGHLCVDKVPEKKGRKAKLHALEESAINDPILLNPDSVVQDNMERFIDIPPSLADLLSTSLLGSEALFLNSLTTDLPGQNQQMILPPSMKSNFNITYEYLSKRIPEDLERLMELTAPYRTNVERIKSSGIVTAELASQIVNTFQEHVETAKQIYSQTDVPTIVWDKRGVVYFCNKAYVNITGFDKQMPTGPLELVMFEQFSSKGLVSYCHSLLSLLPGGTGYIIFPAEILSYGSFIDAVVCMTVKRDPFGIPLTFIGQMLPIVAGGVRDRDISSVMQRKGAIKKASGM